MTAEVVIQPAEFKRPDAPRGSTARWSLPLNVPNFIADVAGMDAEGTGALILAYCHYFRHGSLPDDDEQLARICKLSRAKFRRRRDQISAFFGPNWIHPGLDATIERIEVNVEKRRAAGQRGGLSKSLALAKHKRSEQEQEQEQEQEGRSSPPSPPPSEPRAREADEIAAEVLAPLSTSARAHPGWRGLSAWIGRMVGEGAERVDVVVGISSGMHSLDDKPPKSFEYFRQPIERARAQRTRPLPSGKPDGVPLSALEREFCKLLDLRTGAVLVRIGEDRLSGLHKRYLAGALVSELAAELRSEVAP